MNVLIGCEFSGIVRDAFLRRGHNAVSCDLLPTEQPGPHYQGDIRDLLTQHWHLALWFPPCTHLASSGARWWPSKQQEQADAIKFVYQLLMAPYVDAWALENPIGKLSTVYRKPNQIIQPWQFGHGEVKATCLWLHNLQPLEPTYVVEGRYPRCWKMPDTKNQARNRSRTYTGIADAMATQWG